MSNNFDNDPIRYGSAGNVAVDAGLRTFFRSVYNYMIAGLALTGVVGYGVAFFAFQDGSLWAHILYGSPVAYVVMFAPLGLSLIFGGRIYTMRPAHAPMFSGRFAALMGVALSSIMAFAVGTWAHSLLRTPPAISGPVVLKSFLSASLGFGVLSIFGYTTNRDLSGMGCHRDALA